jgi:hypothetical protein
VGGKKGKAENREKRGERDIFNFFYIFFHKVLILPNKTLNFAVLFGKKYAYYSTVN